MSVEKEHFFLKKSKFANKKAAQNADIPTNLIKENSGAFADLIFENFIDSANVIPVHKKTSDNSKDYYWPAIIFSNILN